MLHPRHNNPNITDAEVALVERINAAIIDRRGITAGWCGLAAMVVVSVLGDNYEIMDGSGHWWARNKTTLARLDPTADQFERKVWACDEEFHPYIPGEQRAEEWHYAIEQPCKFHYVAGYYDREWDVFGAPLVDKLRAERAKQEAA